MSLLSGYDSSGSDSEQESTAIAQNVSIPEQKGPEKKSAKKTIKVKRKPRSIDRNNLMLLDLNLSDSDDELSSIQIPLTTAKPSRGSKISIADILPKPKNRLKTQSVDRAETVSSVDNTVIRDDGEKKKTTLTSMVPQSVRNKRKLQDRNNDDISKGPVSSNSSESFSETLLDLFGVGKKRSAVQSVFASESRTAATESIKHLYEQANTKDTPDNSEFHESAEISSESPGKSQTDLAWDYMKEIEGRKGKREINQEGMEVVDFNVDNFYQENIILKQQNLLEETKRPVRHVGAGKHQLTSLIRAAKEGKEALEEMHLSNKKAKKEAGSKYGFT